MMLLIFSFSLKDHINLPSIFLLRFSSLFAIARVIVCHDNLYLVPIYPIPLMCTS